MDAIVASALDIFDERVKLPDLQTDLAFLEPRHKEALKSSDSQQQQQTDIIQPTWRLKERMKTVSVALVMCLNVGVDPPDIIKTQQCAKLECWFDPFSTTPQKAIDHIGLQLEKQYERWQPRARYKKCLDPTVEEVKKLCTSLRRNAKDDRVLFHFNGHGVPKPSKNGEIWVFNNNYTQYIPLAIYDLQQWMGMPSIYVFDCSSAGSIIDSFQEFAKQQKRDFELQQSYNSSQQRIVTNGIDNQDQSTKLNDKNAGISSSSNKNNNERNNTLKDNQPQTTGATNKNHQEQNKIQNETRTQTLKCPDYENSIHLAACAADQILPMNPDLPADLFTSCLTTPLKIALRWFIQQNNDKLVSKISLDLVDKIPGSLSDRRTMLGEINWIFTAITDTIAWNVLPLDLFQKLFRQDLLVASLFRNFLLAERVMRTYNCTPISRPKMPQTHHHPMWRAWDMVVDLCLSQLSDVLADRAPFKTSTFFAEQLTAFEVWLELDHSSKRHPEQLPIVLQVLLSPVHRLRALDLLGRFLNLGPWAVNSALSVGIFPYVLKLLQSSAREVRPFLVTIWAKILASDKSCKVDLVREGYHRYFLCILADTSYDAHYRTMAAFVMTCIVRDYPPGKEAAFQGNLIAFCLEQITDPDANLRKWSAICLGCLWYNYEDARWCGVRDSAHEKLYAILDDYNPEVRAAAVFSLGTFINSSFERSDHANTIDHSIGMKLVFSSLYDSSVMVRYELVVALQHLIFAFEMQFVQLESLALEDGRRREDESVYGTPSSLNSLRAHNSGFLSPTIQISQRQSSQSKVSSPSSRKDLDASNQSSGISLTAGNILRVNSLNAISHNFASSGSKIVNNVYHIIWKAIRTLSADPHPKVASAAQTIIEEIRSRCLSSAMSSESLKESKSNSSMSEPSSPPLSSSSSFDTQQQLSSHTSNGNQKSEQQLNDWKLLKNLAYKNLCLRDLVMADPSKFNETITPFKAPHEANLIAFHPYDPFVIVAGKDDFSLIHTDNGNIVGAGGQPVCGLSSLNGCHDTGSNSITTSANVNYTNGYTNYMTNGLSNHTNHYSHHYPTPSLVHSSTSPGTSLSLSLSPASVATALIVGSNASSGNHYNNGQSQAYLLGTVTNLAGAGATASKSSRITSLQIINPQDRTLIMTGTNEGAVRIWRAYDTSDYSFKPQLLSAFHMIPELLPQVKSLGMVLRWEQNLKMIYATTDQNDMRLVKVWDAQSECKVQDIPTCAECGVSCLSSDGEHSIAAGFVDGSIRIYDTRLRKTDCRTFTFRKHTDRVLNLHLFKPNEKHINLISGDITGDVRFWDHRAPSSVKRVDVGNKMSSMTVHPYADLFACGLASNEVKVYTLDGTSRAECVIKSHDNFFASQKINKVSSLAFHPFKALLAIGDNSNANSATNTATTTTTTSTTTTRQPARPRTATRKIFTTKIMD